MIESVVSAVILHKDQNYVVVVVVVIIISLTLDIQLSQAL